VKIAYLAKARPDLKILKPDDVDGVFLETGPDGLYDEDALARMADADALVISMEPVNEQVLSNCTNLKIVQRLGAGFETLDLEGAARRGIPCCNVPGANKEAVAEHGMTLMLALTKQLLEADRLTRDRQWSEARVLTHRTFELNGKTLGIIGLGNTGGSLARRARGFGMRVVYNDVREIDAETIEASGAQFMEKEELYRTADIISINTDLNPTTAGLIDAAVLAQMKPSTLLVCCARGGIIDEDALRDALDNDRIAGAGIDVFAIEPITEDNVLLGAKNCIITSHVAGVTDETTRRIFDWAHDNIRAVVQRGEKPQWVLNGV